MSQKYSISWVKGNASLKNEVRIYLRIISNGIQIKLPTPVRVKSNEFSNGKVIKNIRLKEFNVILNNCRIDAEKKITEAIIKGLPINHDIFNTENKNDFESFVLNHIKLHKNKFSKGRVKHLQSCLNMILEFKSVINFGDINITFLQKFEDWLHNGREDSTILSKMSMFISFLNAAEQKGLIDKKQYSGYKRPKVKQKIPVYLTETEIEDFYIVVKSLKNERKKNSGYYFLLSCYTGYRLSDCKAFDYDNVVRDGVIIARAKKNGNIVSIPIYERLNEVLQYCKSNPFIEAEQHARESVKAICKDAGIKNSDKVKFHSGRHSFAMFWIKKGLSIEKVAELLGDSVEVARIYARIENTDLQKEMLSIINRG